ncbi:unnamed protein product [Cylicostephanus goldi]|uniref:Uncharacterized protein n=1 Tax=Cylicostephanus goldi TaxID=71465 RepID=A0A3P7NC46_CYLGO|nr:unnamed protein product [Cylicostephanus goldi]
MIISSKLLLFHHAVSRIGRMKEMVRVVSHDLLSRQRLSVACQTHSEKIDALLIHLLWI